MVSSDQYRRISYSLITLIIFLAPCVSAQETSESAWLFALGLLQEGDDFRAITELKRCLFLAGEDAYRSETRLLIADIYRRHQEFQMAEKRLQALLQEPRDPSRTRDYAFFLLADVYLESGNMELLRTLLASSITDPAFFAEYKGVLLRDYLAGLYGAATREPEWLNHLPLDESVSLLAGYPQRLLAANRGWQEIQLQKPYLAGTFSTILPGLGQAYNGRYLDAAAALVIIGGLGAGSYSLFNKDLDGWGWFAAVLDFLFYLGNIHNAYLDAHRINYQAINDFRDRLVDDHRPDFRVIPEPDGISFHIGFRP